MPDQNTSHDNAIGWMIILAIVFAIGALAWYYFQFEVMSVIRWIKWGEMWVVSLFVGEDYTVYWNGRPVSLHQMLEALPAVPKDRLSVETLSIVSTVAAEPLRMPVVLILGLMAMWCMMAGPGTQYRRKLNLNGLIEVQSNVFPVISPFLKFNPAGQPPRPPGAPVPAELPPFAEALGPEEWLAYAQIPIPEGDVDEQAAYIAFARQLGRRWRGPNHLPPYKQVLLAAFCLKASRKRKEADDMLGRLAQCWSHKKGLQLDSKLTKQARKILASRDLAQETLRACNQHGFEATALLRALATAREQGGVLAPAQFVWLRAHDRVLWYPLNNLGRQSYHMEALGAMAHYKAEKRAARPIPKPKVQEAVQTISEYINSPRARPIPQLDYSRSKKRGVKKPASAGVKKPAKKGRKKA